ncbi:MAG: 2-phosphosulfolactate phosphatase [Bacteroidota bacterium]|nr:2-phosphosulfolactate phosphatase [Bacteroidota bacterium]
MSVDKINYQVCLSPDLLHLFDLKGKVVIVVDILRATSCMVTAFAHGIDSIIPVAKLDECRSLQKQGYKAAAERDGSKVEGFDLDNSPFSYMNPHLKGVTIAVTTTNGTQAIEKSKDAKLILVGAFLNISSIATQIKIFNDDVVVVCAGWKGNVNLEDTLFAGALASILDDAISIKQDAAILAKNLFEQHKSNLLEIVKASEHAKRLINLNIIKDIEFCLTFDLYSSVPILSDNQLKEISLINQLI